MRLAALCVGMPGKGGRELLWVDVAGRGGERQWGGEESKMSLLAP